MANLVPCYSCHKHIRVSDRTQYERKDGEKVIVHQRCWAKLTGREL